LTKEVIDLFEQVFLLTVGRIIKPDTGAYIKLKQRGTAVPALEKAQSRIDENVSEHLIGQAFEVMFKEFERYINIMKKFKGVDWAVYVKMRNKERKNNESKKEFEDEKLFDEESEEEPPKEEEEKLVEEEKKEDGEPEDVKAEEETKSEKPASEKNEGEEDEDEKKEEDDI
jgi:hypothetical protein